jgi:hypothetical protein
MLTLVAYYMVAALRLTLLNVAVADSPSGGFRAASAATDL